MEHAMSSTVPSMSLFMPCTTRLYTSFGRRCHLMCCIKRSSSVCSYWVHLYGTNQLPPSSYLSFAVSGESLLPFSLRNSFISLVLAPRSHLPYVCDLVAAYKEKSL